MDDNLLQAPATPIADEQPDVHSPERLVDAATDVQNGLQAPATPTADEQTDMCSPKRSVDAPTDVQVPRCHQRMQPK